MRTKVTIARAVALLAGSILLFAGMAFGAEINVMSSGGLTAAPVVRRREHFRR
jgi:hypothetical protein